MAEMDMAEGMQDQGIQTGTVPVNTDVVTEKMIPQSELNRIVGTQKAEAYERGRQEALATAQKSQSMGGMQQVSPDEVRRLIAEEAQKQAQTAHVQRVVGSLTQKLEAGKAKYPDLQATVQSLNLASAPHIAEMFSELDNAVDVMKELGDNATKYGAVLALSYTSPHLAKQELIKLSNSIKRNQEAENSPSADEPLSRINPSITGTDSGSRTTRDYRSNPKFRR
jgi:hypothetical protein